MENRHDNFYIFKASGNFDLGLMMGKKFSEIAVSTIAHRSQETGWRIKNRRAKYLLDITQKHFPQYVEELQGYADGAKVDFLELWTISLEDEVDYELKGNKCTTIITNEGKLISHNEDWYKSSEDSVCILLKTVNGLTIFEIFYFNTLGGNSISVNSHGFVTSVNTLIHSDKQLGVPRNVIARWFSETKNPEEDIEKLKNIPRSLGYNLNIVDTAGRIWDIEYTSKKVISTNPPSPFVHTNHYLSELKSYELNNNSKGSFDRYMVARERVKRHMSQAELAELANDNSKGGVLSIMNEKTIGKMIVDLNNFSVKVWLLRESEKGWIEYDLAQLLKGNLF